MADQASHLKAAYQELLDLSPDERIEAIRRNRWIGYPRAKEILVKLEDLLTYPKTHRMPNLLIVGHTNNGKSTLIERFVGRHPGRENPTGDGVTVPVLDIEAPPRPDEGLLYDKILTRLYVPHRPSDNASRKLTQVLQVMRLVNVQMLIIDEIQTTLAGSASQQRVFLNVIKHLGNELRIPIVAAGVQDAARVINSDPQMANRFEPLPLPRWKLNEAFLRLLKSFELALPLRKPSNLASRELAPMLFDMSEGVLGELSEVLKRAGEKAIRSGDEQITRDLLKGLSWVPPSQRRRVSEKFD